MQVVSPKSFSVTEHWEETVSCTPWTTTRGSFFAQSAMWVNSSELLAVAVLMTRAWKTTLEDEVLSHRSRLSAMYFDDRSQVQPVSTSLATCSEISLTLPVDPSFCKTSSMFAYVTYY